ncbi:hypothetical protein [Spirosoma luteum]|uniref:hypothetical protein n=1 Tax=Spirosoma luteum TaxID=431553 RepID=UPI00036F544E|nr:hypothetical protein [Spirosoma luteum]
MRAILFFIFISLYGSIAFAQGDSSKTTKMPVRREVFIPGVNTPISGGGMTAQTPVNSTMPAPDNGKKRKTQPPSDPRAFGVSIPLEKDKAMKDTLK